MRSKALASTILKIFCTFIDADVEQKMRDACMAFAKRFAYGTESRVQRGRSVWVDWLVLSHLLRDFLLLVTREGGELVELRPNQEGNCSLGCDNELGNPERGCGKGGRTLLNPRACRYHSFTELSVDFRDRSNMNKMATASLQTRGNIFTNSRWPPRSHIEKVMVVLRTEMVFSIKLTPAH